MISTRVNARFKDTCFGTRCSEARVEACEARIPQVRLRFRVRFAASDPTREERAAGAPSGVTSLSVRAPTHAAGSFADPTNPGAFSRWIVLLQARFRYSRCVLPRSVLSRLQIA